MAMYHVTRTVMFDHIVEADKAVEKLFIKGE